MTTYHDRKTYDYSPLVVHFTKDSDRRMVRDELIDETHPLFVHKESAALDRLISILESKTIHASPMPYLKSASAVCFTECVWGGLVKHAETYSPYGVIFSKRLIFENEGGPALYVRGDILKSCGDQIPGELEPFVCPFDPEGVYTNGRFDYLHEREWRLPGTLKFEYHDIQYVIVESVEDLNRINGIFGTVSIPRERIIPIEVYQTITNEWMGP